MHNDEMTDATKLAPCPLCANDAGISDIQTACMEAWSCRYAVICIECCCSSGYYPTKAEAIAAWNARATTADRADADRAKKAEALLREALEKVERHLSACQYDPAPYTCLKHRLRALASSEQGEG